MRKRVLLIFACAAALPAAAAAEPAGPPDEATGDALVPTEWALDEAQDGDGTQARKAPAAAKPAKAKPRSARKPRIYGGARISNSKARSRKGAASVGVAVPF